MKKILVIYCLVNTVLIGVGFSWCFALEKNMNLLKEQLYNYQGINYDVNARQDKEIRLLKQDIKLMEKER